MSYETTLETVRELSENATLRPAPRQLRLTQPWMLRPGPRLAIIPYEELYPVKIGGSNRPHQAGPKRARQQCEGCGRHPRYCLCENDERPVEKDFMQRALEKTEADIERRVVVIPRGE